MDVGKRSRHRKLEEAMKLNINSWHYKFNSIFSTTSYDLSEQEFLEYKEKTIQRIVYCIIALPFIAITTTIVGVPLGAYLCDNYDIDLNSITALIIYFLVGIGIEILFISFIKIITKVARKLIKIKED